MSDIKRFFRWLLSLPFTLLWFVFALAATLSLLLRRLSVLLLLILLWIGWFKVLIESKSYGLFAAYVGLLLAMFFSKQLFELLMEICNKTVYKIRYGTPFNDPIYSQPSPQAQNGNSANISGDQQITLTVDQLKELLNKDR